MQTTLFRAATDSSPSPGPASWEELVSLFYTHALTKPHPGPIALGPRWRDDEAAWKRVKVTMPAWSPAALAGQRSNENVTSHSLFVGDLDKVPEAVLATVRARCAELGWAYVLQPTPTDEPSARRYRLVVPYDVPIPVGRVKIVREAVASLLRIGGETVDPATKDPSRIYFLPCLRDDGQPPATEVQLGRPIDTATIERAAGVDLLSLRWPARGRHEAQLALAGGLVKAGLDEATALEILCDVCRAAGDEDRPKRAEAVRRAVELHDACEPLRGWRFLSTILGTDVVSRARALLGAEGSSAPKTSIVVSAALHETVRLAEKALASSANVYRKDTDLVQVVHLPGKKTGEVAPMISRIDPGFLKVLLSSVATFVRPKETKNGTEWIEIVPPSDVVTGVMESRHWPSLSILAGVVTAPAMREDGTFFTSPGYDDASGYVFEGLPVPVPDAPTQDDARAALARVASVIGDFPFADESGAYVVIAAALTLFARAAITSTPCFIFEASTRGSGKTMLADVVSILATGRAAERVSWPGAHEAETEKLLCSAALEGRQMIVFDNVATLFGGPAVDKVLTAVDRVSFRILGASEMRNPEWRTIVVATGNNIALVEDTATRSLVVRLEPETEHPEERTDFREADLLAAVRRDRTALMTDVLIVLKAWAVAGRPQVVAERKGVAGRFPSWNAVVPQALAFAGAPSICETASAISRSDTNHEAETLRALFEYFPPAFPRGATAKEIVKACWPQTGMTTKHPELAEALEALCERDNGITPKMISGALRKCRRKVVGRKRLENHRKVGSAGDTQNWIVLDFVSAAADATLTTAAE